MRWLLALATVGALAGCGGGGYGGGSASMTGQALRPLISTQPADVTVAAGQPASFSVAATGYMPLSYQWQRNGVDIMGATQASYTLAAATPADNGSAFRAQVMNIYGSATSSSATLTVN